MSELPASVPPPRAPSVRLEAHHWDRSRHHTVYWPSLLVVSVLAAWGWLHVTADLFDARLQWVAELQRRTTELWNPPLVLFLVIAPFAGFILALSTRGSPHATALQDGTARWVAYAAWVFPLYALVQSCVEGLAG